MRTQFSKIAFAIAFAVGLCFAQEAPDRKLAVYVFGASDAGINKSLGSKLLVALTQNGEYAGIADQGSFQDELAKSGVSQISQAAKRRGVDYVCTVDMVEAFGAYSITANLIKISNSQVVKTGSTDRALKSLEDLTAVSNELARQLLPSSAALVPPVAAAPPVAIYAEEAPPPAEILAPVAKQKRCARTYNINEILFKIEHGFPVKLKDCSSKLAKDMLNPFGKKPDPKSYMMQCAVEGIKNELPEGFSSADKVLAVLTNFVQTLMNSASAGGSLDPKKLVSVVGSMNVEELLSDVKTIAATAECMVNEPYTPPFAPEGDVAENDSGEEKVERKLLTFSVMAGLNSSHTYTCYYGCGDYGDIIGVQLGLMADLAPVSWFHLQSGLMYIQKGMKDAGGSITAHYLELPLLLTLKLYAFRLNTGPYIGLCLSSDYDVFDDIGWNAGIGFDIGRFYIGVFYDYGLSKVINNEMNNKTLGFNFGVNL
ncbi:MAG: PorT family protein [Fibromonadales bacterium]|nr:PorT family protein [Fibromonadales bacterium]